MSPDMIARAKAGDRAAVNEVLRLSAKEIRAIVRRTLLGVRKTFDVLDGATADATLAVWQSIRAWDPQRVTLIGFARKNIVRATLRHVADMGHPVVIPDVEAAQAGYVEARDKALVRAQSMDAAVIGDFGEVPFVETRPGAFIDPSVPRDAAHILAALSPREADILQAHAAGDTKEEIGAALGFSGEHANTLLQRALARARAIARVKVEVLAAPLCSGCGRTPPRPGGLACERCYERSKRKSERAKAVKAAVREAQKEAA